VYTNVKIKNDIREKEDKPPLVSQQCALYSFKCDLCDASYVGYTCRHLHQCIEEHKGSVIGDHLRNKHGIEPDNIMRSFNILRKCKNKLDVSSLKCCFMKELKPALNKQCDSIEEFTLRGALWVIRANFQRSKAVKKMLIFIFPF